MEFTLSPEVDAIRLKTRTFIEDEVLPIEADRSTWDAHENIRLDVLDDLRAKAKAADLWAPQAPVARGGMGLDMVGRAAMYEEANRSIFGPVCFNAAAPDDGNIAVLAKVGTEAQQDRWLQPLIDGKVGGVPFPILYLFAVWILLILGARFLSKPLRDSGEGASAPEPESE